MALPLADGLLSLPMARGVVGALRMGLQQGVACLGCCWALMALAFAGGTMNLLWMGGAMVLMTIEKLPTFGRYITAPLGAVLLASFASALWFDNPRRG